MSFSYTEDTVNIREVWSENIDHEFGLIYDIVDDYPYIAMDTEFPGNIVNVSAHEKEDPLKVFEALKANVDQLKLIQLGLTLSDENGNLPTCGTDKQCIWQFNFRGFNAAEDPHAEQSINFLRKSGIDLEKFNEKGVDVERFGELLTPSGIVMNDDVSWVVFQGSYDFGYLLKVLTCMKLPDTLEDYLRLVRVCFPIIYDVRCLMRGCDMYGGLNSMAKQLDVVRVGTSHQAGSDSLLTWCVFAKLKRDRFNGNIEAYAGLLHWLNDKPA